MKTSHIDAMADEGKGIFRLSPAWVPRSFCRPGKRIKLHPDDYYHLGLERGGIDERWLSSTTSADNGPGTPEDEGLSYIVDASGKYKVLLKDAVDYLKGQLIGQSIWQKYGSWPIYSKFFDNMAPLPHHIHHDDEHAGKVQQKGKPEMYFFPAQLNNHGGEFPFTFFGLNPDVSKEEVKAALIRFEQGDNRLLDLSRCYKLTLDTGWDVPPGTLHAPGSLCTYEPQVASDVYAMFQSVIYGGETVPKALLWKDTPDSQVGNYDYLMELIDWDKNIDPDFHKNRFMAPVMINPGLAEEQGYYEEWICYKSDLVSAKRLTVLPGRTVKIKDRAAYGTIILQGYGSLGAWDVETPTLIRYGALTLDEFFISEPAAKGAVTITNKSSCENLVMLKHFSDNPDLNQIQACR